jgi:hypothetical protein
MFSFKDARFGDECEQLAKRLEKLRAGRPGHALRASPADTRRARVLKFAVVLVRLLFTPALALRRR